MIRPAQSKDIPRLLALLLQVESLHHDLRPDLFREPCTKYTDKELEEILQDKTTPVFVDVDAHDHVLGYLFAILKETHDHRVLRDVKTLYIDDLCVDATYRGCGIGGRLYQHAVQYAKEQGCYNVTLNVWSDNRVALDFYESQGMHPQRQWMETLL